MTAEEGKQETVADEVRSKDGAISDGGVDRDINASADNNPSFTQGKDGKGTALPQCRTLVVSACSVVAWHPHQSHIVMLYDGRRPPMKDLQVIMSPVEEPLMSLQVMYSVILWGAKTSVQVHKSSEKLAGVSDDQ